MGGYERGRRLAAAAVREATMADRWRCAPASGAEFSDDVQLPAVLHVLILEGLVWSQQNLMVAPVALLPLPVMPAPL